MWGIKYPLHMYALYVYIYIDVHPHMYGPMDRWMDGWREGGMDGFMDGIFYRTFVVLGSIVLDHILSAFYHVPGSVSRHTYSKPQIPSPSASKRNPQP